MAKINGNVNVKLLNLREKPTLKSKVLDVLPAQAKVIVDLTKSNDTWYCVSFESIVGYCMKEFITLKKPTNKTLNLEKKVE